ncbi:uncharacterized protein [Struthio camelus]|uniref:uncharacterized protein n=1 Tax=Struthio camelus TaxID=8801 RepID=UPI0036042D1A
MWGSGKHVEEVSARLCCQRLSRPFLVSRSEGEVITPVPVRPASSSGGCREAAKGGPAKDREQNKQTEGKGSACGGRLLSRERLSPPPFSGASWKGGKAWESRGNKPAASRLQTIRESSSKAEEDGKQEGPAQGRPRTAIPACGHQHKAAQAWRHPEPLPEVRPASPGPPLGKEASTAAFVPRAEKRKPERLPRLHKEQLSVRASHTLQVLETYQARREEWKQRVELNRQRNSQEKRFLCPGQRMTLQAQRERDQDLLVVQRKRDYCGEVWKRAPER